MKKNILKRIIKITACIIVVTGILTKPLESYAETFNEYHHYQEYDLYTSYKSKVVTVKVPYNYDENRGDADKITITIKYDDSQEVIDIIDVYGNKK